MKTCSSETRQVVENVLESGAPLELSFVELIVAASECSEDESEIFDLVDDLMESGRVTLEEKQPKRQSLLDAA